MKKAEQNKQLKKLSLLDTAFELFTTKGVNKTSIAEISQQAGMAKGTFYLYFKDKYDIRNKLISHESSKLFKEAIDSLNKHCLITKEILDSEGQMIFIVDYVINALNQNKSLLTFISKNLSWGVFKEALTTNVAENDINFQEVYLDMLEKDPHEYKDPEIMLYLIVELVSATSYSSILYCEPAPIEEIKPYLYETIRSIIKNHRIEECITSL